MNISIFAAAALLVTATAASAQPTSAIDRPEREATRVRVTTNEADFASSAGVRTLYARLAAAAVRACDSGSRDLQSSMSDRACAREALARAVTAIDRPALTALRTGVAPTRLASR